MVVVVTFADAETSVSSSRPIDLYTIATPTTTYRLTSYASDVTFAGDVYTATPGCGRGTIALTNDISGSGDENVLFLPLAHPIVRMYAAFGIPEQQVIITLLRYQPVVGLAIQQFTGFGQSLAVNDNGTAQIRIPSTTNDALKIQLPVIAAQRTCNHRLFDARCSPNPGVDGPDPSAFRYAGTVSAISSDGLQITVPGLFDSGPAQRLDTWSPYGRLQLGSESRRILSQNRDVVTVDVPFVAAVTVGELAVVEAGCDHSIGACVYTFNNRVNFGGHPQMNTAINPWLPSGLGVVQQA